MRKARSQEKWGKTCFSTKQPSHPDSVPHQGHDLISSELRGSPWLGSSCSPFPPRTDVAFICFRPTLKGLVSSVFLVYSFFSFNHYDLSFRGMKGRSHFLRLLVHKGLSSSSQDLTGTGWLFISALSPGVVLLARA